MRLAVLVLLLFALPASAQPKTLALRFPQHAEAPKVEPAKLIGELLYVIEADVPHLLLASPLGLVNVVEEVGPIRIRGKFVDGVGKAETREYKGKQVWIIEAVGKGKVELLVIPAGTTKAADVVRKTLEVDSGEAPRPPPDPKPDPKPDPNPAPIPLPGFRVLIVYETGVQLSAGQQGVVFGKAVRDYLNSKCVLQADGKTKDWWILDKDTVITAQASKWLTPALARPRQSLPWIIISDGKTGFEGPLPADVNATLTLLKKYGG